MHTFQRLVTILTPFPISINHHNTVNIICKLPHKTKHKQIAITNHINCTHRITMGMFIKLEDSPMFHKQICSLEYMTEEIRDRCQKLYRGCKKYITSLGESSNADIEFAETLVAFGGGQDDPVSVSIGGPVISQFITAFRELASYKELLRSQVEHVIVDRLMDFMDNDLQAAKESRRRFEKAGRSYDQSRERFVSLKRNTREDIVVELEEDLQNSKSAFERSRFNLVNALMSIEAKKKHEFLESISALMDAHFRYFKQGNGLLSQMEPLIHQVLTYAQQSREQAIIEQDKLEKRIQEFRTQKEMDNIRASSDVEPSTSSDGIHFGMNTFKSVEALQSFSNGEVQTIKQGYLLKRSATSRDWKRRFFVLDSQGSLYYYRNKDSRLSGSHSFHSSGFEQNSTVFGRFRSRHKKAASLGEENLACRLIDLRPSTIKVDAEDTDLRLCFRIISPAKSYTLQAENGADRMEWINKITGAIASLLNSHILQQSLPGTKQLGKSNSSSDRHFDLQFLDKSIVLRDDLQVNRADSVSKILREIPGNEFCAECGAAEPDWASLNLGILLCIECSGVHRNLGVHISKVRSLTLDVKVWESTVVELFKALGNTFCNSVWEGLLLQNAGVEESSNAIISSITKPSAKDSFYQKEKFIQAKYVERLLVVREANMNEFSCCAASIWQAVKNNNLREVYRLIVLSNISIVNTSSDDIAGYDAHSPTDSSDITTSTEHLDPAVCSEIKVPSEPENCFRGCSLLHLACHLSNPVMLELLLQFGADINKQDSHGRTPLHYCISLRKNDLAKFLLRRGARPSIRDGGGLSALERAMEMGAITDDELFILLSECQ